MTRFQNRVTIANLLATALTCILVVVQGVMDGFTYQWAMLAWCLSTLPMLWAFRRRQLLPILLAIGLAVITGVWLQFATGAGPSDGTLWWLLTAIRGVPWLMMLLIVMAFA